MKNILYRTAIIAGFLLAACAGQNTAAEKSKRPAHHTENGFKNLYIKDGKKNIFSFFSMRYFSDTKWADHEILASQVPVRTLDPKTLSKPPKGLQLSWLGHSTFLLQVAGLNILTDPIFSDRASPVFFSGPKRYIRHVIDYDKLPIIDYVVISHNHYDHLDADTIDRLGNQPVYLVPLGLKAWFMERGIKAARIREMDWWDRTKFPGVAFQATPSQHWSARGLFDRRETLWATWLIESGGKKIWFAGDTGYNPVQFKEIGKAAGGIDMALIPIGGYAPRWFMAPYHIEPKDAVNMHLDLNAKLSIGMHWGTFPLTAEGPIEPVKELARQLKARSIDPRRFITLAVGETIRR